MVKILTIIELPEPARVCYLTEACRLSGFGNVDGARKQR